MFNLKKIKGSLSTVIKILQILCLQEREHDSEDEDEDKYADDIDMPGQNFDSKRRITVRNLRIREDTAKVSGPSRNTGHFYIQNHSFTLHAERGEVLLL